MSSGVRSHSLKTPESVLVGWMQGEDVFCIDSFSNYFSLFQKCLFYTCKVVVFSSMVCIYLSYTHTDTDTHIQIDRQTDRKIEINIQIYTCVQLYCC